MKIFDTQKEVFKKQIELAMEVKKPLVFHIRGSNSTMVARTIMRDMNLPKDWPIHMHCFTNSWEDCQKWSHEWTKMKFGFTPDSFVAEVVQNLPLNRILLETDAPFFFPKIVSQVLKNLKFHIYSKNNFS